MSESTTSCPNCQFENHTTCHFCIRCGDPLKASATPATTTVLAELPSSSRDAAPRPDVLDSVKALIETLDLRFRETSTGFVVEVPIGERTQKVSILLTEKDRDGEETATLVSVCGPVNEKHAVPLLQLNAQLKYCAYGIRKIKDQNMFVVTASQYGATADPQELQKMLKTVAKTADRLEEKLTKGGDDF